MSLTPFLVFCTLICLNTSSPVDDTVSETLGGMALLEKVCHWGQALEFPKMISIPSGSLSLSVVYSRCDFLATHILHAHLPAPMPRSPMTVTESKLSKTAAPKLKAFFK